MEQNKLPNNNEIENEKEKLKQEIKKLYIYYICYNYNLDKLLYYFPNRATEISKCFYGAEGEYLLQQDKQETLQEIIMEEFCSLLYPCIEKGYKVLQLDGGLYHSSNQQCLICLNIPKNNKNIGISIGQKSKFVFTNGQWKNENDECKGNESKLRLFPVSGIQINHNYKDNKFHNEIKIFNYNKNYTLIIYPYTKDIKLTDFDEKIEHKAFCDQNNKIFQNKGDIIHFFSTLSFAEIEQVLQILNKHLEGKNYFEVDIGTVLKEIKNTIEENRKEEKKNEESSIGNNINNSNNLIPNNNLNNNLNNLSLSSNDLNKDLNQKNTFVKDNNINNDKGNESNIFEDEQSIEEDDKNNKNETKKNDDVFDNEFGESNIIKKELINEESNEINKNENKNSNDDITKTKLKIEEEDKTSCNCCITCLKQCWPFSEKEK